MTLIKTFSYGVVLCFLSIGSSYATNIDLSTWSADGNGAWSISADGTTVIQTKNSNASFFYNNSDSQGFIFSASVFVNSSADDDFFGFALGYNSSDISNDKADYLLIDWKKSSQKAANSTALAGLSLSNVTAAVNTSGLNAFTHDSSRGVDELLRAVSLGNVGWQSFVNYEFDILFTQSLIEVFVNDVLQLSLSGDFNNGSFGFYNNSQSNVSYSLSSQQIIATTQSATLATSASIVEVAEPKSYYFLVSGILMLVIYQFNRKRVLKEERVFAY